jgi:hypothetical protein
MAALHHPALVLVMRRALEILSVFILPDFAHPIYCYYYFSQSFSIKIIILIIFQNYLFPL